MPDAQTPKKPATAETNHRLFIISLIIKGFDSVLEIVGGIALFFATSLFGTITYLTDTELIEDPNDFIATHVKHYLPFLWSHSPLFGAIYLLSHGIIKIALVIALLYRKLWAYPAAIAVFALFIVYQMYRFSYTHSILLVALSFFDAIVLVLAWNEYQALKRRL